MTLDYGRNPADWVCVGGAPARAVGGWRAGLPSYEHETNGLRVYDLMIVYMRDSMIPMMISRGYKNSAAAGPDGLVPAHGSPHRTVVAHLEDGEATLLDYESPPPRQYRPKIHRRVIDGWQTIGSQAELGWRHGLVVAFASAAAAAAGDDEVAEDVLHSMERADERADALLVEHLNPQQRIEYTATGKFRVIGGHTGNLYRVDTGDGFDLLDKVSGLEILSYCLHTEYWMPITDIALATKLALEDPDLEVECLENANYSRTARRRRRKADDWIAHRLEGALLRA